MEEQLRRVRPLPAARPAREGGGDGEGGAGAVDGEGGQVDAHDPAVLYIQEGGELRNRLGGTLRLVW